MLRKLGFVHESMLPYERVSLFFDFFDDGILSVIIWDKGWKTGHTCMYVVVSVKAEV